MIDNFVHLTKCNAAEDKNRSGILWSQSGAADYIFSVIFFFIVSDGSFDVQKWLIVRASCVPARARERARRHKYLASCFYFKKKIPRSTT